jgi:hypothetical protein
MDGVAGNVYLVLPLDLSMRRVERGLVGTQLRGSCPLVVAQVEFESKV